MAPLPRCEKSSGRLREGPLVLLALGLVLLYHLIALVKVRDRDTLPPL